MANDTSSVEKLGKDLRLDRIATWLMIFVVGIGVKVASGTYYDLRSQLNTLNVTINDLNVSVALLNIQITKVEKMEDRLAALEAWKSRREGQLGQEEPK